MRAVVWSLLVLTACSGYDDLALLEVETIEPPEIEPGTTLRIHGSGFALGRAPSIRLRGSLYRPGVSPGTIEANLGGLVRSESLIEVPIGAELFNAFGGRATFDGELRVGFPAADGHRDVFAAEGVRIDFLPDTAAQLRADGAHEEREERVAARGFGLELSREELGTAGVRVVAVDPQGLAEQQGVEPDDVVIGLDGLSVYGWRDFVPDPSRTESTVLVSREGLRGVHALRWPHAATERAKDPLGLAVFVLLGLLLGWSSPAALCLRGRYAKVPASSWAIRATLMLVFAALMLFVPALHWTTMWILVLGTFAALFALATRDRVGTSSFAFAVGATLTVMLLAGTASITEIVGAQGPGVLRWFAFQSPASFLAFGAFLCALGAISTGARLSASLYAAPAAVLGAVLFLGGWPLSDSMVGIAVLFAKAAALLVAAGSVAMRPRIAAGACAAGLGLALIGSFVELGALFPMWSGLAVGAVCALGARAVVPPLRQTSVAVPV